MIAQLRRLRVTELRSIYSDAAKLTERAQPAALLLARIVLAYPFWNSGLGKVNTLTLFEVGSFRFRLPTPVIEDATFLLFAYEFFTGLPRWLTDIFAVMSTIGELTLPVLVVLGLLTRFAAAGLLAMTLVIQIFVYPQEWWAVHSWWAVLSFVLVAHGGGAWSLDRRFGVEAR
jgi:putative oxidoreductase